MEFQQTLLKVDQALNSEDVQALVFLCADLLDKDVSCISTACDLFTHLQQHDLLTSQRPFLLVELLQLSRRSGLLRQLDLFSQPSVGLVSPYRKLLFNLSENIDADDLKSIKFLLQNKLPRRKLEDNVTMLNLLLEMEKMDLLSITNLETLEEVIKPVCPSLRRRIIQFKEENAGSVSQKTEVSYMSARQADPEELHVCPGVQASTSNNNRPATLGSLSENVIWNDWRQESSGSSHSQASCEGPCALSSEPYAPSLVAVDARAEGQSLDLSQPSSSGTTDATFSSEQRRQVSLTSPREEKNISAANPVQGKKRN
ncbi:hypothetical protein AAFF_G00056110 [Aldrovandia affinis]|uniref:DED domain-containing protein n=1 Tax=Aldrovandia affinis TaxID=143900 RepID=A0AAD7WEC1_9TELE|nr:hypothetical protein AAFF_G00056110 [Aldrovandia affinis]